MEHQGARAGTLPLPRMALLTLQLSGMIGSSPRTARQLALHAGQILWITRQEPYQVGAARLISYLR